MTRFEVGLITPLRFRATGRDGEELPGDRWSETATVSIAFEGFAFVWHDPDDDHDPAVTATHADSPQARRAVRGAVQRLLSALAFETAQPISTVGPGSGSGETDPRWRAGVHPPRSSYGIRIETAPVAMAVAADERVRLALAIHREALSANSPLYRFLAYWNAIEAALPDQSQRRAFLDSRVPNEWERRKSEPVPPSPSGYLWDRSRRRVAHGAQGPGRVANPDEPDERARLESDADVLEPLVRAAILSVAVDAVTADYA